MEIILLLLFGIGIATTLGRVLQRNKENAPHQSPYELPVLSLQEENERFFVEYEGARYHAREGEETDKGTGVSHWHGRMGEGIGLLQDQKTQTIVGQLYHLREDERNVLLAYLPQEGYPLTDMLLLIREETALPPITPDAFAYGEVYRVLGEVPEEELVQVGTITDQALLSTLVTAWTKGEDALLPHGEYERYRIRLHSKDRQGLYVSLSLNVCREQNCFAVEKRGFEGDTLISPEQGLSITNK